MYKKPQTTFNAIDKMEDNSRSSDDDDGPPKEESNHPLYDQWLDKVLPIRPSAGARLKFIVEFQDNGRWILSLYGQTRFKKSAFLFRLAHEVLEEAIEKQVSDKVSETLTDISTETMMTLWKESCAVVIFRKDMRGLQAT